VPRLSSSLDFNAMSLLYPLVAALRLVFALTLSEHRLKISNRINYVANNDEECSAPVELALTQNRLFS
jgi:hypothetical protein